jgi:hypothetical protein
LLRRIRDALVLIAIVWMTSTAPAFAQQAEDSRKRGWSVGGGIGLTASPTSFLMQFDAPYRFGGGFSFGPQLQVGVAGGTTIVSFAANGRYDFDGLFGSHDDFLSKISPFANGGLGFTYMTRGKKKNSSDNSGIGFLMEFGGGVAFALNERISLESAMQFNIIPDGAGPNDNDKFYWSWQMIGARFHF